MPPPSTCFLSTQALHHRTNRTQLTLYRSNPLVCVLDERPVPSSVETITHRCQPALLAIQPNVRPHNYQVLPCNESSLELPKPPIHYAVPFIGYLLELMFRPNLRIKRARQFDGVYTSNGFLRRTHFVTDYNAITAMLKDTESFLNRGAIVGAPEMFGEVSCQRPTASKPTNPYFRRTIYPTLMVFAINECVLKWLHRSHHF